LLTCENGKFEAQATKGCTEGGNMKNFTIQIQGCKEGKTRKNYQAILKVNPLSLFEIKYETK